MLLAGDEPLVGDHVGDGEGLGRRRLVGPAGRGGGADLGQRDRLARVLDVGVLGDLGLAEVEALEHDHIVPRELRGVEGELHRRLAVRGLWHDLGGGADGVPVGARHRLAGRLVHEGANQLVGLAGQQVLVGDRVRDGHGVVGERHVRARLGVGSGGADLGDVDRLVLVLDVGVDRHLDAVLEQALERDDGHVVDVVHLERELHLHGAGAGLGLEGGAGRGGVAVRVEQGLPRGPVHEGAVDGVLAARLQVLVPDRVGERHVVVALGDVGPLASGQLGLDARAGLSSTVPPSTSVPWRVTVIVSDTSSSPSFAATRSSSTR